MVPAMILSLAASAGLESPLGRILRTEVEHRAQLKLLTREFELQQPVIDRVLREWDALNARIERVKRIYRQRGQIVP